MTSTSSYRTPVESIHDSPSRVILEVPARVVAKICIVVALLTFAGYVLLQLTGVMIQLAIAAFLAIAADPVIRRLMRRGATRGRAVAIVMAGALLAVGLIGAVFVPPLVEQGDRFIEAAPGIVDDVRASSAYHDLDTRFGIVDKLSEEASRLPSIVGDQLGTVLAVVAAGLFGALTIFFLTVFLLLGGGEIVEGIVHLFPRIAERRWWMIVQGAYTGISAYVGGAIIIALIGGSVVTLTALVLDLPYALPLGLWMMLLEIIPMIGATIGAIPAIVVAFAAGGVVQGIVVLGVVIVYQQFENIVVQPRVQGKAASLSPFIVFLSVIIGSQLLGVLGALFAVPVAGVLQIFLRQLVEDHGEADLEVPRIADAGLPQPPDADDDGAPGVASDPWPAADADADAPSDDAQ